MPARAAAQPATPPATPAERRYRMRDLVRMTGLSRQTIHFYTQEGLLPPAHKTAPNMAWYGEDHLLRLRQIQKLQHERFLPLKTIKAILDDETAGFDAGQREILRELKARLPHEVTSVLDARKLAERHGVPFEDLRRMAELGFLVLVDADSPRPKVSGQDAWIVVLWGQVIALGVRDALRLTVDDMQMYTDTVSALFEKEKHLALQRVRHLAPDDAARVLEKALPLVHAFLAQYHAHKVRSYFRAME